MAVIKNKSLYDRLGGYDAICAAVDDLMPRLFQDQQIGIMWNGRSLASKRKSRQMIVDFLSEATGGCTYYTGRDMKTAHAGLNVGEIEWQVFMSHVKAALANSGVHPSEQREVASALNGFKKDIVER